MTLGCSSLFYAPQVEDCTIATGKAGRVAVRKCLAKA